MRTKPLPGVRYDAIAAKIARRAEMAIPFRKSHRARRDLKNLHNAYKAYLKLHGPIRLLRSQ